jgi:hypothetical protein
MATRTAKGTLKPSQSGQPSEGPVIAAEVKALALHHTTEAIGLLVEIMRNPKAPLNSRAAAASTLLDRGLGKPELSAKVEAATKGPELDFSKLSVEELAALDAGIEALGPLLSLLAKAGAHVEPEEQPHGFGRITKNPGSVN